MYEYLTTQKISGKQITYAEYLFGTNDIEKLRKELSGISKEGGSGTFGVIDISKQYFTVIGITSDVSTLGWVVSTGIGLGAIAGGIALVPFTAGFSTSAIVAGAGLIGGGLAGGFFVAPVVKGISGNDYISPTIIEANSEAFGKLKCKSVNTLA